MWNRGQRGHCCVCFEKLKEWGIGVHSVSNVATTLVDMYAKSGCIERARKVFDFCHGLSKEAVQMISAGLTREGYVFFNDV